ncbi:MAG: HlyD family efflux transporter periplasmic adaptor subunit [Deltaproteobacteria bacterium]|nr:HlyD family efflux transporter periplasmic adaptor subunit [Deltaproteobacteria bacterium]
MTIVCACACLAVGCGPHGDKGKQAVGAQDPLGLRSEQGEFEQRVLLTGEIDAIAAAELKVPQVDRGRAPLRWLAANGAMVKKGDLVAELDNSTFANDLQQKTIQVSQAETELQRQLSQAALLVSEKTLDMERKRIAVEKARLNADMPVGLFSKRDVLEAKLALTKAETDLQRAQAALINQQRTSALDRQIQQVALDKAKQELAVVEAGLQRLQLRAPIDGMALVGDHPEGRPLQVGDEVFMGMTIVRMPDLNQIRVKAYLSDVDDRRVVPGMSAEVIVDTFPGKLFAARVDTVSTVAREPMEKSLRRVFEVGLVLEGAIDKQLRPGLSARVEVIASKLKDVTLVPRTALRLVEGKTTVTTAQGQTRDISVSACNASVCVVDKGLAPNTALAAITPAGAS